MWRLLHVASRNVLPQMTEQLYAEPQKIYLSLYCTYVSLEDVFTRPYHSHSHTLGPLAGLDYIRSLFTSVNIRKLCVQSKLLLYLDA